MSQLAAQIAEIRANTARLVDVADGKKRCRTGVCHPDGPCTCRTGGADVVPDNFEHPAFTGSALLAMRGLLNKVPAAYWQLGPTNLTIACSCRLAYRVPRSIVELECTCGRTFLWSSRSLYALKPDVMTDDDVEVCDLCCRDMRVSQGEYVRLDGTDAFVCHGCRGESA